MLAGLFTGLALALALLGAAPARAGWKTERAQDIAYAVWGAPLSAACPNGLQASYATTVGVDPFVTAWAQPGVCTIHFSPTLGALREFEPYCTITLHESGHIIGLGHTEHGIMAPNPIYARSAGRAAARTRTGHAARRGRKTVRWTGTDPRCDRRVP